MKAATVWTESSALGFPIILDSPNLPLPPYGGKWAAWLGGDDDEVSYIQQQVTVPVGAPYLAYWHWFDSADTCGYDFARVLVNGTVVDQHDLCISENTSGWVKHVVNLSPYEGQTVTLQIRVETDFVDYSSLFVDDVAFQATPTMPEGALEGQSSGNTFGPKPSELKQ